MSSRTRNPDTGLIAFHPSVVVLVGVTLKGFDQQMHKVNGK